MLSSVRLHTPEKALEESEEFCLCNFSFILKIALLLLCLTLSPISWFGLETDGISVTAKMIYVAYVLTFSL